MRDNCRDEDGSELSDRELVLSTGLEVCAMAFWLGLRQPTDGRRGSWKRSVLGDGAGTEMVGQGVRRSLTLGSNRQLLKDEVTFTEVC